MKKNEIIMISICSYCSKIIKAEVIKSDNISKEEIETGFQLSHGSCEECHKIIMQQIKDGTYE